MAFPHKPKTAGGTKTKKAPKFKPTPKVEQEKPVGFLPEDFQLRPNPRSDEALVNLLREVGALLLPNVEHLTWVVARTDEEYAAVWAWARVLSWALGGIDCTVLRDALTPPAFMVDVLDEQLNDATTMLDWQVVYPQQLLDEAPVVEGPEPPADAPAAAPAVPDATGQLPLVQEPPAKPITALRLETPEQVRAVAKALDRRITKLNELAKKNREEGKETEAKSIEREVTMIRESLTSQLRTQGALAFNEGETLVQAVARLFQGEFRTRVRAELVKRITVKAGESSEDARQRQLAKLDDMEKLIGKIGDVGSALVVEWLSLVADRAYHKGTVAHGATPSNIAREALQAFEIERQGREE